MQCVQGLTFLVHLSVAAYGESRISMTYDPCKENIGSLCPLNADTPIEAFAVFPISRNDVAGIPYIALGIPDVEGFARLMIFANSTQTEIGCFQAAITNGQTFSQPQSVGVILASFTFFAMVASFVTTIYGVSITHMRMHYAHSFSVLIIFETFHSIFLSGALSVNWPSVLPAWWSNFAWTVGMFANDRIVHSVSSFTGNAGNTSQVGGAGPITIKNRGGIMQEIFGRSPDSVINLDLGTTHTMARRVEYNASNPYDYMWNGHARTPGMPLPGTWQGLGGTLSSVDIPAPEAFTISLIWFLVVLTGVGLLIFAAKVVLDLLVKSKLIKSDGFDYFRSHWLGYIGAGMLRTIFIGFFAMTTLATFQLTLHGPPGPTAIAAVIFLLLLLGLGGIIAYACHFRLRQGKYNIGPDSLRFESGKLFKIPFVAMTRESKIGEEREEDKPRLFGSVPFVRVQYIDDDPQRATVHLDEGYIKRFGWISGRYRRTRWWFFTIYLVYQLIRACFVGGGARNPLSQVCGLFIFEVLSLVVIVKMKPFESNRNTAMVWMLSVSKVITTGLSIAFLPEWNLSRTVAAVFGIIIIVVQGFLTVAVLILVVLGTLSSCMALSRNRERFHDIMDPIRISYFEHVEKRSKDVPKAERLPEAEPEPEPEPEPLQYTFNVRDVRRAPKIEDEVKDEELDAFPDLEPGNDTMGTNPENRCRSRANSASSRYSTSSLPRAARVHRASWSAKDFAQWDAEASRPEGRRMSRRRSSSLRMQVLAAQGISTSEGTRSPEPRPMTPARESMEEAARTTTMSGNTERFPSLINEVDEEMGNVMASNKPALLSLTTERGASGKFSDKDDGSALQSSPAESLTTLTAFRKGEKAPTGKQ